MKLKSDLSLSLSNPNGNSSSWFHRTSSHQSEKYSNTDDNVSETTRYLIGDGSPRVRLAGEFHGLRLSYSADVFRFNIVHIFTRLRYASIIFVFTSYPLRSRKRYVKWRKIWRAVMGENCTLFDFDRLDGIFKTYCHFQWLFCLVSVNY